jgi:hypothetical protein
MVNVGLFEQLVRGIDVNGRSKRSAFCVLTTAAAFQVGPHWKQRKSNRFFFCPTASDCSKQPEWVKIRVTGSLSVMQ